MSGLVGNGQWAASDMAGQNQVVPNPGDPGFSSDWQRAESEHTSGQLASTVASEPDPNNVAGANSSAPGEKESLKFFVGGIHPDCWEDELRGYFSQFTRIKEVHVATDKVSGRNRGFGFVTIEDIRDKDKVFECEHFIRGKKCSVRPIQPDGVSNIKRKVFIGGINPAMTEGELEPYFTTWGPLEKLTIMRDVEGNSRGFGFVIFHDEETCKRVVDHRIHSIGKDSRVECRKAETRTRINMGRGRLPPPMGGMGYPSDPLCYDPGPAHFDWNPALTATSYGAPTAQFPGATYSPQTYAAAPMTYGVLGMPQADPFKTDAQYAGTRYDPGYGPMRGGAGRGTPMKRTYPY